MTNRRLRASYLPLTTGQVLDDDVLLAVAYAEEPCVDDPRLLAVPLAPLAGSANGEIWRGRHPVKTAIDGLVHHSEDDEYLAGWLTIEESPESDLASIAEQAYGEILRFQAASTFRHIWRMWNYVADINLGDSDDERYRQFCLGRSRAFSAAMAERLVVGYPAASAVGKKGSSRTLQVCWIASRQPALAIENPRQIRAYDYPRQYGPAAPSFSRAVVTPERLFLVSGTASIVGHESRHSGDISAQLDETFRNLTALSPNAAVERRIDAGTFNGSGLVKAYVRDPESASRVKSEIVRKLCPDATVMLLCADICRSELVVEIELVRQG